MFCVKNPQKVQRSYSLCWEIMVDLHTCTYTSTYIQPHTPLLKDTYACIHAHTHLNLNMFYRCVEFFFAINGNAIFTAIYRLELHLFVDDISQ